MERLPASASAELLNRVFALARAKPGLISSEACQNCKSYGTEDEDLEVKDLQDETEIQMWTGTKKKDEDENTFNR